MQLDINWDSLTHSLACQHGKHAGFRIRTFLDVCFCLCGYHIFYNEDFVVIVLLKVYKNKNFTKR